MPAITNITMSNILKLQYYFTSKMSKEKVLFMSFKKIKPPMYVFLMKQYQTHAKNSNMLEVSYPKWQLIAYNETRTLYHDELKF